MNVSDTESMSQKEYSQQSHSQQSLTGSGFALSVQGARHLHDGIPCQDHSLYHIDNETVFIGVADGHGDAKHARSHIGSKLALEIAQPILREALDTLTVPQTNENGSPFKKY